MFEGGRQILKVTTVRDPPSPPHARTCVSAVTGRGRYFSWLLVGMFLVYIKLVPGCCHMINMCMYCVSERRRGVLKRFVFVSALVLVSPPGGHATDAAAVGRGAHSWAGEARRGAYAEGFEVRNKKNKKIKGGGGFEARHQEGVVLWWILSLVEAPSLPLPRSFFVGFWKTCISPLTRVLVPRLWQVSRM